MLFNIFLLTSRIVQILLKAGKEYVGIMRIHEEISIKDMEKAIKEKFISKGEKITDLNKKGKKLYMLVKPLLQEHKVKLDSTLRGILIKSGITKIDSVIRTMALICGALW